MELEFRQIGRDDYALMEVFKRATAVEVMGDDALFGVWFPPERTYAAYLDKCRAIDPAACVLAVAGGEVAGALHLNVKDNGQGHLNNIYLKPEWRRRGIGRAMDDYALGFFRKHGCREAILRTLAGHDVVGFYEKLGWEIEGVAPDGMVVMRRGLA